MLRYCPDKGDHLTRAAQLGSSEAISSIQTLCRRKNPEREHLYHAAMEAKKSGHPATAGMLFDQAEGKLVQVPVSDDVWEAVDLEIDRRNFNSVQEYVERTMSRFDDAPLDVLDGEGSWGDNKASKHPDASTGSY